MSTTIVITSDDSITGPGNFDMTVQLAEPLDLPGLWTMSLVQVDYTSPASAEPLYIYTNLVQPTVIGSGQFQLLDIVYSDTPATNQSYRVPYPPSLKQIRPQSIDQMDFTFRNGQGQIPTPVLGAQPTVLTLQLQQLSDDTFLQYNPSSAL